MTEYSLSYYDRMQIYIFRSRVQRSVRAFTVDATGDNLPSDYAPWHPAGTGEAVSIGDDSDPAAMAVLREGYLLVGDRHRAGAG